MSPEDREVLNRGLTEQTSLGILVGTLSRQQEDTRLEVAKRLNSIEVELIQGINLPERIGTLETAFGEKIGFLEREVTRAISQVGAFFELIATETRKLREEANEVRVELQAADEKYSENQGIIDRSVQKLTDDTCGLGNAIGKMNELLTRLTVRVDVVEVMSLELKDMIMVITSFQDRYETVIC